MSHAPFSPSSAKRWINCHGSFGLGLQLPEQPDTEYSREGTRLHEAAADYVFDTKLERAAPRISAEDRLFLKPYLDHVAAFDGVADTIWIEQPVRHPRMPALLYGTPDCVAWGEDWLEVVDLKTGYGILVRPENNDQLLAYALMVLFNLEGKPPTNIRLTIVQPTDEDQPVKTWETTPDRVLAWGMQAEIAIEAALKGSTAMVPGDWCRFCKAKSICPVLMGHAVEALPVNVKELQPDKLAGWLDRADLLQQWLDAIREMGHALASNGIDIPGWELKPKRAVRTWDDEPAVLDIARRRKIKIFQDKLLSPAMAERVHKNLPEELTEHIVAISNGTNLVKSKGDKPRAAQVMESKTEIEQLMTNLDSLKYGR